MARSGMVRFICTDGGTHPTRELASVNRYAPGDPLMPANAPPLELTTERNRGTGVVTTKHAEVRDGATEPVWRMECPTCGLDFQCRESKFLPLIDALLQDSPRAVFDLRAARRDPN